MIDKTKAAGPTSDDIERCGKKLAYVQFFHDLVKAENVDRDQFEKLANSMRYMRPGRLEFTRSREQRDRDSIKDTLWFLQSRSEAAAGVQSWLLRFHHNLLPMQDNATKKVEWLCKGLGLSSYYFGMPGGTIPSHIPTW